MKDLLPSLLQLVVLTFLPGIVGQINSVPGTNQRSFFLDTTRDCNDVRPREVGQSTVNIYGVSSDYQGTPVTSCVLTLSTENIREPYKFKIQYLAVTINDPGINFYVYDGEAGGRIKWAWNSNNQKPSNLDFDFTTGSQVTFKLTRGELDRSYDIRIVAIPTPSQVADCSYGSEYNCGESGGYNYRVLGTKEIAGIVAGCFGVVIIIVIIVVCLCFCRTKGITRKWTEEKLGHVNTAASLHTLNGHTPKSNGPNSTKAWTTAESSRSGFASIRRSPNLPRAKIARSSRHGDRDSLFDSNASLPVKRPLPPPQVNRNPRGMSERSRSTRYHDSFSDDDRYSDDHSFSTATKNFSHRNLKPPTYREALRHDSESSADEHTFVQANESHQQSVFVERVIEPRVKKKNSPHLGRAPPPPLNEDDPYDKIDQKKLKKSQKVDKAVEPSSEEEEETDQSDENNEETDESEETESEEESEAESETADKPDTVYSKPNKTQGKQQPKYQSEPHQQPHPQQVGFRPPVPSQPQQFQQGPYPGAFVQPGVHHPQARYGQPNQLPTGSYPQGQPFYPQGQAFPVQGQAMHPGQQYPQAQGYPQAHHPIPNPANPQPNAYHQANFTVPLDTQSGHHSIPQTHQPSRHRSHRPSKDPKLHPEQPPVYSYLVQRGYQPVDGRYSPVSTSTGASNLSADRNLHNEDSDISANLGSGVELLKRKK